MTSSRRAGRITTFGFAIGAGLVIVSGAGAATAAAAPDGSGHAASSSSAPSGAASAARSARASTGTSAKPRPKPRQAGSVTVSTAPVVTLSASKRTSAAAMPTDGVAVPTGYAKQSRAPRLPTPAEIQQSIVAGLDSVRRTLDTIRKDFELLVKHQVEGIRDNLTTLRYDLAAIFSPGRPPIHPDIPVDGTPGLIGNPLDKVSYFLYQNGKNTCLLMSVAMVVGQLRGADQMPTAAQIIEKAATTPSTVTAGTKIYDPVKDTFVQNADALALLDEYGVTAMSTQYSKNQGNLAYTNLQQALVTGNSVIVTVKSQIIWGWGTPSEAFTGDHAITVLGIDTANNIVYVNDGAWKTKGQGMGIPLNLFMSGWSANDYQTITAYATPAQNSTVAA